MFTLPAEVEAVCAAFASLFTRPSWRRAQALLGGVLLAPCNATISSALRALGLANDQGYPNYHRLLSRAAWSARQGAGVLLGLLVRAFAPSGPLVIGLDDTIERRRGSKITARAIYRDAVRSLPLLLSEDQRPALVELAPARAHFLGPAGVGAAFPHRPRSL